MIDVLVFIVIYVIPLIVVWVETIKYNYELGEITIGDAMFATVCLVAGVIPLFNAFAAIIIVGRHIEDLDLEHGWSDIVLFKWRKED
jgi:hypothetical protein